MDMNKICRVCLREDQDMLLIFEEKYTNNVEANLSIAAMLSEITIYKVQRFDELPHLICSGCFLATQNAFAFKRSCEKSYRQLVTLLGNNELNLNSNIDGNRLDNSTQTVDTCLYPCERCDEKFFTFYELKSHRDKEHKGSDIICRYCSKRFNRIGYLKTHIAIFHPEIGLRSHLQCHICKRQFTRSQHLKRHLALLHKYSEEKCDLKDENTIEESTLDKKILMEEENFDSKLFYPGFNDQTEDKNFESGSDNENIDSQTDVSNLLLPKSEDEDKKLVTEFFNKNPSSGFTEVLLNNTFGEYNLTENTIDPTEIKSEKLQPTIENSLDALDLPIKRRRGRPRRKSNTATTTTTTSPINDKKYKCSECDKRFSHESNLKRHKLNHEIRCKICSLNFSSPDNLTDHIQATHNATKLLNCENCDEIFTRDDQLKEHYKTKHKEKTHKCDKCNKTFRTKPFLQRHLATHGNKRYVCKECLQDFSSKDDLNSHIKMAGHDKPLLCPECGLRCKTSTILLVHMRRHTGEKPFKCKFCSKGFPRMDDLRVHERYHTGEKSHFCETCGKGFQRKYNLTIHLRVHTGEKPYKCPHCQQAFAQGNDLKAHIRRHTGERFRCDICGGAFLQGYQIRQHKLAEHGIKDIPPTQRVAKFTSREAQEKQIQQNLQKELHRGYEW
ncbi:zinc finger protein 239-like isoform X2 [Teleopsis dalmanni]|uniref:zinc finger protein 239-like isoform X2 n=1 Tax=Teleopsis dalmanni TaxID=139649 RepID=UPI0018CF301F|nr:zinc finger protein 239-like isoform X2 [Teleopsis dalmanni]